ncbi:hypothetical protein PRIPAC_92153 [Pristionchus pacificus]|uniref:Uncharacterized protein n=1 Tax=Pristionchus pacificus TaxID=54126 RepID=A0A2A6CHG4_PRIPA|nr:hypothetical protein PRIPAC_92153 [Pristionchus pacificus]|eukprot:PDM77642.1 hypothetical protein PRIPAC_34509 [Pristionchus pacificus]
MLTLLFLVLLSGSILKANTDDKPFQCYNGNYEKPNIAPRNCTGPTCLTHVLKEGPQPSCDFDIPNTKGSDRSCITTLCSYIEIAEKPGGVVENLGKIGDTLCVKDRNTVICCCEGNLCNTPESTQPFMDNREGDKSAFSKESCAKQPIA